LQSDSSSEDDDDSSSSSSSSNSSSSSSSGNSDDDDNDFDIEVNNSAKTMLGINNESNKINNNKNNFKNIPNLSNLNVEKIKSNQLLTLNNNGQLAIDYDYLDTKDDSGDDDDFEKKEKIDSDVASIVSNHIFTSEEIEDLLYNDNEKDKQNLLIPELQDKDMRIRKLKLKALVQIISKQNTVIYKKLRMHRELVESENRLQCSLLEPFMKKNLELARNKNFKLSNTDDSTYYTSTEFKQVQSKFSKYDNSIKKPIPSIFVKSLIYNNQLNVPIVFNLHHYKNLESEVLNGIAMVSLYSALWQYEKSYNHKLRFAKSKVGDTLKLFNKKKFLSNNVLQTCNSFDDQTIYPLVYGMVPEKFLIELEYFVLTMVHHMNDQEPVRVYDFMEGELETILLECWRLQSVDLQTLDCKKFKNFKPHFDISFKYTCHQLTELSKNFNKNNVKEKNKIILSGVATVDPIENLENMKLLGHLSKLKIIIQFYCFSKVFCHF